MKRFLLGLLLAFSVVTLSAKELNVASFNIRLNTKGDHIPRYANIQVYSNCENTLALIEKYDEKN